MSVEDATSLPASPRAASSDPLALADALLAEAERHPTPAPLIAAARALLAGVASTPTRSTSAAG